MRWYVGFQIRPVCPVGAMQSRAYFDRAVTLTSAHFRAVRRTRCGDAMLQLTSFVNVR